MSAPMVRTKTPGIYKRGSRYVFTWRDQQRGCAANRLAPAGAAAASAANGPPFVIADRARRGLMLVAISGASVVVVVAVSGGVGAAVGGW
jgi:hypothetical protein